MLDPKDRNESKESAAHSRTEGDGVSYPRAEAIRSLSTEMPYTLALRDISRDALDRILHELAPDLAHIVSGELCDLVDEGRCFKGEQVRAKYFSSAPISIHQYRTFVLNKEHAPIEQLHSVKIIDERCQPENPTLELFKLGSRSPLSARFSFDCLPISERWDLVNRIGSLVGIADAAASFQKAPREAEHACSTGSTMLEVAPGAILETLSTTQPLPAPKALADRQRGQSSWTIDSLEYSQPDYEEQGALLKLIDPREFQPVRDRNLLSSLLLHTARMYATQEGEISLSKLGRASRHISEPLTLTFERWMVLGDPNVEDPMISEELLSILSSEPDEAREWEILEGDDEHPSEEQGEVERDSAPDLSQDSWPGSAEEDNTPIDSHDAGIEDIPDFGTRSRVTLERRSSPYGQYCISFCSEAPGLVTDQVNDDSFFNKDAPTIRVDFLDDRNARSRWRLLSKLHGQLAESMGVPEDEAHNLDAIERDFSASDLPASGEQVALYLGRMRVIASRG